MPGRGNDLRENTGRDWMKHGNFMYGCKSGITSASALSTFCWQPGVIFGPRINCRTLI